MPSGIANKENAKFSSHQFVLRYITVDIIRTNMPAFTL